MRLYNRKTDELVEDVSVRAYDVSIGLLSKDDPMDIMNAFILFVNERYALNLLDGGSNHVSVVERELVDASAAA